MMRRLLNRQSKTPGLSPGTLVHVGEQKTESITISFMDYNASGHLVEGTVEAIDHITAATNPATITWINVSGLHQIEVIKSIGLRFGIHPLLLEDILNTGQRPKMEQYDDHLYVILKMLHWVDAPGQLETEQISIVLGKTFVITFQEQEKDVLDPLRRRIREGTGQIRQQEIDYLAYALIDVIVDHYYLILEKIGEDIEEIEDELIVNPTSTTLQQIHDLKRELLFLRRSVWPLREVIGALQRGYAPAFQADTLIFLRDVYEHTIQIIDTIETFRDIVSGLLDIYLSTLSNKTNEVMKVLTIIATIFIPLTFFTSVYGMNFKYMPELEWPWSYPILLAGLLAMSVIMIIYFKKKDWL